MLKLIAKISILLLLFALHLPFSGREAHAHATPITYNPVASSLLEKAPSEVAIHFSERIESGASSITVYSPDGEKISERANVDNNNLRRYYAKIIDGGIGTYTVSWQVVSADDGHFTKGAFSFSVGEESIAAGQTSNQFQISHKSALPEGLAIWFELLGQSLFIGGLAFLLFVWRPLRQKFSLIKPYFIVNRFSALLITGYILTVLGTISYILFKSLELQSLNDFTFWSAIIAFTGTTAGKFSLYKFLLSSAFLILFLVFRKFIISAQKITKAEMLLWALIFASVFLRAWISHAAASDFYPEFSIFINFVHLVFKDIWVGALIFMSVIYLPVAKKLGTLFMATGSTLFSKLTGIVFGAVASTGAYIVWLHLKDLSNIFTTTWGTLFMNMGILGSILFGIRLFNQIIADKAAVKICEGNGKDKDKRLISYSQISIPLEMAVGVILLFVTSFIIITTPPISPSIGLIGKAESQGIIITMTENPHDDANYLITASSANGKSLKIRAIVVTLTNEKLSIGPIIAEPQKIFEGGWTLSKKDLSPSGEWKIDLTLRQSDKYDAVASFQADTDKKRGDNKQSITFTLINILLAFAAIAMSYFLYKFSANLNDKCRKIDNAEVNIINKDGGKRNLFVLLALSSLLILLTYLSHSFLFKSQFHKLCEKNEHFWTQSVPMKDGKALSSLAVSGCTVGIGLGQYHFADIREYKYFIRPSEAFVKIETVSENLYAGEESEFKISFADDEGKPIKDLVVEHDKLIHVVIIGEDMSTFSHIHAEDLGPITPQNIDEAVYTIKHTFPRAGKYVMSLDFVVRAQHFSEQKIITISGDNTMKKPEADVSREKNFGIYKVTLNAPQKASAKEQIKFSYTINGENGPILDLQPYLSAPMHIAVVRNDLRQFYHTHGELPRSILDRLLNSEDHASHSILPEKFGPTIEAYLQFPTPGIYYVFGELKHADKVVPTAFAIEIE